MIAKLRDQKKAQCLFSLNLYNVTSMHVMYVAVCTRMCTKLLLLE